MSRIPLFSLISYAATVNCLIDLQLKMRENNTMNVYP